MIHEVRVLNREQDPVGADVLADIKRLNLGAFDRVTTVKVYRFEGINITQATKLGKAIVDVDQVFSVDNPLALSLRAERFVEVGYKPGVMNPEAASLMKMASDLGLNGLIAADSSYEYHFFGDFTDDQLTTVVSRLLVNKTVQMVISNKPSTLVIEGEPGSVAIIAIRAMSDDELVAFSKVNELHLNLEEMSVIREYFRKEGRDPTDVEIETLAQTWSEHCGHKTTKARLIVNGKEKSPLIKRLRDTATKFFGPDVISAFEDNSGVVYFYDEWGLCAKVETHNSPSALEPYGGAATGSGGVFRDIMGTGQGAKVIASTDMFCFAPPDLAPSELPTGCRTPDYLLRRVVAGVRDYGNRMGVPTNNGSLHFHPDFRAKPSVIVGAYGIIPVNRAKKGQPKRGDLILALGGRTGRDGIHGATFSSGEMTDQTINVNSTAVQIGNAIEEKRMSDAMLDLRDRDLIEVVTDCGAGGFSSAIGEMGSKTGAYVELEKAPLKYAGLAPREIWISESQERMVVAIKKARLHEVLEICASYNVEATVLGHFTDDHRLTVIYHDEKVCDLSMEFLHDGLPQRVMVANWQPTTFPEPSRATRDSIPLLEKYKRVMGHLNVCSKEPIVRLYDHGVQGTNALYPFTGVHHDGPNDAVVLRPILDKPYGVVISHGMNPILNRIDPYWGSISAAVEALANLVAVGGNPRLSWLIDNFIWPFPDEESLGALDLSFDACCKIMEVFGIPFISGKDSLSSTYRGQGLVIKIPPVLCVSAFGKIPDVSRTISADFKRPGSHILLVGNLDVKGMAGSVYYDTLGFVGNTMAKPDLANLPMLNDMMHKWIGEGRILSAHDVSEGGVAATLAEMCFGGNMGARIFTGRMGQGDSDSVFFNETPGCFLVEVSEENYKLTEELPGLIRQIGVTLPDRSISVNSGTNIRDEELFQVPIDDLRRAWQQPMKEIFAHAAT